MLRGALSNESRPTEPQDSGPTAKDSFLEDKPLSLSRQFENYELVIGKDGKAIRADHEWRGDDFVKQTDALARG